jgi:hypothetical protein
MGVIQADLYGLGHYSFAVVGFVLIFGSAFLFIHMQFKMRAVGYKTYPLFTRPSDYALPLEYLRVRSKYGWSPWLVYLMPTFFLGGVALLLFGVSR